MLIVGGLKIFVPLAIVFFALGIIFFVKARNLKRITVCSDCGNELNENDKMCQKCGNPISDIDNKKILYYVIVGVSVIGFLYYCIRILRGLGIFFNIVLKLG